MRTYPEKLFSLIICTLMLSASISAQTTAFTYQGNLNLSGSPANGNYDFEFVLFDALNGGSQVGTTQTHLGVAVANGTFSALLDFGAQFPGADRFMEIRVRPAGGGGFQQLLPRQKISSQPYAVKALSSETASSATTAATATNALSLGGVAANQYVLTTDPRMADPRTPTAGSSSYIQNGLSQQASSNFNISGTGTANVLNATTQFNIGNIRIVGIQGALSVGFNSGLSSTGSDNSFFGHMAGRENTTGAANSMFGSGAGILNTTGSGNSYFGVGAGQSNLNGSNNSFFGLGAGQSVNGGSNNTLVGANTNFLAGITFATAIGAGAVVATSDSVVLGRPADLVRIPGNLTVLGSVSGNGSGITSLNAGNISTGSLDPARFGNGVILNQSTPQASSNFNISGTGTANILAASQFNIGNLRVLYAAGGSTFVGLNAGMNSTVSGSSFFGTNAGASTTSGSGNSFFGNASGMVNTIGEENSFFGSLSGQYNTASSNSFFGYRAGSNNTSGGFNAFFGNSAGRNNTTAQNNAFFGSFAGLNSTGFRNSFFGSDAGALHTTGGLNSFFGYMAGGGISSGNYNLALGANATFGFNVENASAIGARAQVNFSNSMVLGSVEGFNGATETVNVGIGTVAPTSRLEVRDNNGSIRFGGAGCPSGSVSIGLNGGFGNCEMFTLRGNGNDVLINRPTGGEVLFRESNGNTQLRIRPGGVIQIPFLGTAGATALCRNASSDIAGCSSSLRYKENISPFRSGLDLLLRLRPISFNWKDGGMLDLGLVAEDVAAIEPLLTTQNANGEIEGVKYDRIGVVLINAVKEQQEQIVKLEKTVNEQREYMEQMRLIICELKPASAACRNQ